MAGISPATLERIRTASDIVDVIGAYLPLKKAGANFTALCPFHKEKTPSFNVNAHKQIFHCFGCHKGGDVFTFVKEFENIGFVDAVRRLAERAKIPLEFDNNPAEQQSRHLKDQLLQIHDQIVTRWQNCLANEAAGQSARDYLAKRGVSADAIKLFRIGAAPDAWDDTVNWARSKNYELALVEKAGLILRKEGTDRFYDRFRGRLMFPICDEQGRVIGFSGRVLSGDDKTAKYVNSPETPIFTKSKVFFGLDKSKRAILDAGYAVVCEGQLDLIACFMAGVQNVVAPQGTAFTDQHARIIRRYVNEVVLCFDSDEAGQNAAVRSLDHLLASGLAVRVAIVPTPHDPDSFIKNFGGEKFRELVQNAEGFFDYYLSRLCKQNDANSDKGRIFILCAMAEAVHKTDSAVLIDTYAQKTALRLGVSAESVRAEFKKIPSQKISPTAAEEESFEAAAVDEAESPRPSVEEFWLLKLVLLHDELVEWTMLYLDLNWIQNSLIKEIIHQRFLAQQEAKWTSLPEFLDQFQSQQIRSLVTEVVANKHKISNPEYLLKGNPSFTDKRGVVQKLRDQFYDSQIELIKSRVGLPELNQEQVIKMLRDQLNYGEMKRSPLSPLK